MRLESSCPQAVVGRGRERERERERAFAGDS